MTKITKFLEYNSNNSLSEQELLEMANATEKVTGISNVVLWMGPNPSGHWKRIKVSNVPNKFDGKNCFTITIPDFKIIGDVNKFITVEKLEEIQKFVTLNMQLIIDYSDYKIETLDFLLNLKKI
jgi:hypothetical protein